MLPKGGAESGKSMKFTFNDPEKDIPVLEEALLKHSKSQLIEYKDKSDIQKHLKKARIPTKEGGPSAWKIAALESPFGRMDFSVQQLNFGPFANFPKSKRRFDPRDMGDRPGLYLFEGKAYNQYDFGNFLWGAAMSRLGVGENFSQLAAHVFAFFQARPGDDTADQRAIEAGHMFQSKFDISMRAKREQLKEKQWESKPYRRIGPGEWINTETMKVHFKAMP